MTCPRCGECTDRFTWRHAPKVGVWAMKVTWDVPLICTRCLTDWMIRAADDWLLIIGPHESIKAKGGAV